MKAYIFDDIEGDQRLPHDSGQSVPFPRLNSLGVLTYPSINSQQVENIAKQRHYKCRDEITVSKEGLGAAYESKIKSFFEEHLHEVSQL